MPRTNAPIGSSFNAFLRDEGLLADTLAVAAKAAVVDQINRLRTQKGITKCPLGDQPATNACAAYRGVSQSVFGAEYSAMNTLCESVDRNAKVYTISHMTMSQRARLLALARRQSFLTAEDAAKAGLHSQFLTRLTAEGVLERVARGQYRLASRPISEHHGLVVAARAAPEGVICLLSALAFHGMGTQLPADVWVAIRVRARAPVLKQPPLRIVRFSDAAFTEGIETHQLDGQPVRIYSVAKTLADLFKYRNKIGLDVAIEALREAWGEHRFTMDELDRAARACRVTRVMKPYVEAVVA